MVAPYNDGPETIHILWAKPLAIGGLVGGELGPHSYEHGSAYQFKFASPVIINGILYYNRFQRDFQGGIESQGIIAADLHTGEELWFKNNTRLAFGQIAYWDSFNLHGAYPYLWETIGSTWNAYDAFTGEWVYTMENVPSGTNIYGPKGEILRYVVNTAQGWMALFNSTAAVSYEGWAVEDIMEESGLPAHAAESAHGSWIPFGRTIDASDERAYSWNVTIPVGLAGSVNTVLEDRIIGSNLLGVLGGITPDPLKMWCISTAPGHEGQLLYNTIWTPPPGNLTIGSPAGVASLEEGVFIVAAKETRQYWGFSLDTGEKLWGPTEPEPLLNTFTMLYGNAWRPTITDGKLFTTGMAGVVNAYDIKTGTRLWTYEVNDPYTEIQFGNNWPITITFITDGKIYLGHIEHSSVDPRPRGAPFICLDVETGEEIFRTDGAIRLAAYRGDNQIIGDSIIVAFNSYDNRLYAIGKGPSATTVTAPDTSVPLGTGVLIKGTVTDESSGTKENSLTARFPHGVPAISDADMGEWMKYVYQQFERPTVTGVQVKLEAYDPNGNYQNLGTTTTDSYGRFGFAFEPEVPGTYWISATFEGSDSYYGSLSTTYLLVDPAPSPAIPIESEEPSAPLITTEVAIVLAVAVASVIGVVAYWILRKRK